MLLPRLHRAHLRLAMEAVADHDARQALGQPADKCIIDAVLDHQARAGGADLAGVEERGVERVVHRGIQVGIGKDDVRVLAAQLQADALEVAGGGLHDAFAGIGAAGEGHQVHVQALGQLGTDFGAAGHQVEHARRQVQLGHQLREVVRGQRRQVAGFDHHGIAGAQRGRDLPRGLQQRVVPRRDQAAHANRLAQGAADHMVRGFVDGARLGCDQPRKVAEGGGDIAHVGAALGQRLAGVERLQSGELLGIAVNQFGDLVQQPGAVTDGRLAPRAVEGLARSGDGQARIGAGGFGGLGDHGLVGRAEDGARALVDGRLPLAVDIELGLDHCCGSGSVVRFQAARASSTICRKCCTPCSPMAEVLSSVTSSGPCPLR
ncbi:hypothetical protein D3C72_914220 [compost metagenome]